MFDRKLMSYLLMSGDPCLFVVPLALDLLY